MTLFVFFILLTVGTSQSVITGRGDVYTNHWAVRITGGPEQVDRIAAKYGYINLGQVMTQLTCFVFCFFSTDWCVVMSYVYGIHCLCF